MRYPFLHIFLIILYRTIPSTTVTAAPVIVPEPVMTSTFHRKIMDTIHQPVFIPETAHPKLLSVTDFGAAPGRPDNADAFQAASDYVIAHPGNDLMIPVGNFFISRPWVLELVKGGKWGYFHIKIIGAASAKSSPDNYLTTITCGFTDGFGIGIQFGRDIEISNIAIKGRYKPPPVNAYSIATTLYSAWINGSARDSRYAPYAGIAIDPFCDSNMISEKEGYPMRSAYLPKTGRGGTSGVKITGCRMSNFPVGIILSPNGYTQNNEDIDLVDDNIFSCKVAVAICQDQSKDITIEKLKCWGPVYTVLDGISYGRGTGGGSTNCYGWNIAGCVNQLFNVTTSRFPLSAVFIYAESLFRIGYVSGGAGASFINCQVDLLSGPGIPSPDYIIYGGPFTWRGGMLRDYDNSKTHRMNLSQMTGVFADMTISNPPMVTGLYGYGLNLHPSPTFQNVNLFYGTGNLKPDFEGLVKIHSVPDITVDRIKWVASFKRPAGMSMTPGDYILASPTSTTGHFYDLEMNKGECSTVQIGRITSVKGDSIYLDDVGLNAYSGNGYDALFIDKVK